MDARKQKHMINAATEYLQKQKPKKKNAAVRFDVVSIKIKTGSVFQSLRGPEIDHIEGAFEA